MYALFFFSICKKNKYSTYAYVMPVHHAHATPIEMQNSTPIRTHFYAAPVPRSRSCQIIIILNASVEMAWWKPSHMVTH